MNLFDASALLAFALGEEGADAVEEALDSASAVSAANWSEVAQKTMARRHDWYAVRALLLGFGLVVEPVTPQDAEAAAARWAADTSLSLADRLCLATGDRLGAIVWTADQAWGTTGRVRQIRPH